MGAQQEKIINEKNLINYNVAFVHNYWPASDCADGEDHRATKNYFGVENTNGDKFLGDLV